MTRGRIAGAALAALVALTALAQAAFILRHRDALRPVAPGQDAPPLHLLRADGGPPLDLSALRGRVVLLDFWATWCGACRETMPVLQQIEERVGGQGLEILSVSIDDGRDAARKVVFFARRMGLSFPIYLDDGSAAARYRVDTIPRLVLIDKVGRVRRVFGGSQGLGNLAENLGRELDELLAEPGP